MASLLLILSLCCEKKVLEVELKEVHTKVSL